MTPSYVIMLLGEDCFFSPQHRSERKERKKKFSRPKGHFNVSSKHCLPVMTKRFLFSNIQFKTFAFCYLTTNSIFYHRKISISKESHFQFAFSLSFKPPPHSFFFTSHLIADIDESKSYPYDKNSFNTFIAPFIYI